MKDSGPPRRVIRVEMEWGMKLEGREINQS